MLDNHERKIKGYFESLDLTRYMDTYREIPKIVQGSRQGAKQLPPKQRNQIYGLLAEECASTLLKMYQTQYKSTIIEGVIFEYEPGKTTEIDLIFITDNVIYIIECKHRSESIEVLGDGSFKTGQRFESPINQNLGHIRKLFGSLTYGNLIPSHRIFNIVYLLFNENAQMHNPITFFKKDGLDGAFAGHHNLLPLIHKIESERGGGKLPMKTIHKELMEKSKGYRGKQGMKKHIKNLKQRGYK